MRTTSPEDLLVFLRNPLKIRNICILAHVDHGKTSLADSLVASNGIISQRMAGKLRYMDSRPDEQERGITMKSSAITLHHVIKDQSFLINLIDSPGHVDFSGEVCTAVRICDGAIIVVDVVEGCAPQTVQVLRQAWSDNLKPILVLNKIDRLILEKKMTPVEAYVRLVQVLEQVNAVMGSLFATDTMQKMQAVRERKIKVTVPEGDGSTITYDWDDGLEDSDDSAVYFQPETSNVIFASALDGWGFTIDHFVDIYSQKVGINKSVLRQTLWGDFWLNAKEKKVQRKAQAKGKKPLFVQFILENLWQVYDAIHSKKDKDLTEKIVKALGLKIHARDSRQTDPRAHLFAVCSQWLPLGKTILDSVCDKLPSPCDLSEDRVKRLIANQREFERLPEATRDLKDDFLKCSADNSAPVIIFVSKMFPVNPEDIIRSVARSNGPTFSAEDIAEKREKVRQIAAAKNVSEKDVASVVVTVEPEKTQGEMFMAFARIFSGKVKEGDEVFVLGPKHKPEVALELLRDKGADAVIPHVTKAKIGPIHVMMGREMEKISEAFAGNVVAIGGLQDHLVRSGTLSNTVACPAFTDLTFMATPIVRVAVEPKKTGELDQLVKGLKLLYQADPCVEVYLQETGEHVLVTAGEVHLQRCLEDLRKTASQPVVPFRETIVIPPTIDMVNEAIETDSNDFGLKTPNEPLEIRTPNRQCFLRIKAYPLPIEFSKLLDENVAVLKTMHQFKKQKLTESDLDAGELSLEWRDRIDELRIKLHETLKNEPDYAVAKIPDMLDRICCFGPRHCGPNVLINQTDLSLPSVWPQKEMNLEKPLQTEFTTALLTGFQMATLSGPLCEEPMMGVCIALQKFQLTENAMSESDTPMPYGPLSGQLISTMRDGTRKAFQMQPQRLMVALYSCIIQTTADVLGKVYGVINRRRGRVLSDKMQEGSDTFNISTLIPVCESFGFAEEIRKKTSGLALPQLVFSHWEVLDVDPYWIPTTEEEYAHFGDKADAENIALKYINQIRKRKGLHVEEKVVAHAEKQRTLGRNK